MRKTAPRFLSSLFVGLLLSWGLLALSLFLVLAQTWLYPHFSKDRINTAGLREEVIQENYRTLIAYNLNPKGEPLTFQGLGMSEKGRIHFAEVKDLFQAIIWTGGAALALAMIMGKRMLRVNQKPDFLLYACRISIGLPLAIGLMMAIDFDQVFVRFHQLFFHNDYWLFQPEIDPIINYLPESFFLLMALAILGLWLFSVLLLRFLLYPRLRKGGERGKS